MQHNNKILQYELWIVLGEKLRIRAYNPHFHRNIIGHGDDRGNAYYLYVYHKRPGSRYFSSVCISDVVFVFRITTGVCSLSGKFLGNFIA